jgi:hypothetical protein
MTPETIIQAASEDGVQLVLSQDGMTAHGDPAWRDAWLPIFREHKAALIAELHRERRHAKVLSMLGDGRKYAVLVTDETTDPVIATVAIRGLASFEMAIPHHSYNGMVLLELIEKHSAEASQSSGDANLSSTPQQPSQSNPTRRTA